MMSEATAFTHTRREWVRTARDDKGMSFVFIAAILGVSAPRAHQIYDQAVMSHHHNIMMNNSEMLITARMP